ncbi:MAG TPA: META domain-containing protein [Propionicimonas sp.]|uniref:META domain-containing protein n=1 Tax=Propionicimonas sp. TaxID=1955623 RepID=UPI002F3F3647
MRKYLIVTVGLLATLAASTLTACAAPTPAGPAPQLTGTNWTVTAINGEPTIAGHPPTMTFAPDRVSGTTGCNSYSAGYTLNGAALTLSQAAMTAMACEDAAVMAQEQSFGAALPKVTAVRAAGSGLELVDSAQKAVFALAAVVNKQLEGPTWQLSAIIAKAATASPVAGSTVTLQVSGDQLSGKACNTFRGQVTVEGTTFKAGPLMSTKMACADPAENAQETAVLAGLEAATTYAIVGNTLTLTAGDGTGLEFRAA